MNDLQKGMAEILENLVEEADNDAAAGDIASLMGAVAIFNAEKQEFQARMEVLRIQVQVSDWLTEYMFCRMMAARARLLGSVDEALQYEEISTKYETYLKGMNFLRCELLREGAENQGFQSMRLAEKAAAN